MLENPGMPESQVWHAPHVRALSRDGKMHSLRGGRADDAHDGLRALDERDVDCEVRHALDELFRTV